MVIPALTTARQFDLAAIKAHWPPSEDGWAIQQLIIVGELLDAEPTLLVGVLQQREALTALLLLPMREALLRDLEKQPN